MPTTTQVTPCILVNKGPQQKDVTSSIIEFEVQEDRDLAGVFRMRLAIVREDSGKWKFLDEDSVQPWAKVDINLKTGDQEQPLLTGYITNVRTHIDTNESASYLELAGMDTTCLMSLEEVMKEWAGQSDSDIATAIFSKYSLTPDVQSTSITHQADQSSILQRETDIQFLKRLARRNGYECGVTGETGYFRKPQLDGKALPFLAAHFADATNLTSFDVDWNLLLPTAVEMDQIDFFTKAVQSVNVAQSTQALLGTKGPATLQVPVAKPNTVLRHAVTTGLPEMTALANGVADDAQWFIEARGEVDGQKYDGLLHARNLVPVKGVGEIFSGMYYLTSVRHKYTVDKFVMNFTARRNATVSKPTDFSGGGGLPF